MVSLKNRDRGVLGAALSALVFFLWPPLCLVEDLMEDLMEDPAEDACLLESGGFPGVDGRLPRSPSWPLLEPLSLEASSN